MTEYAASYEVRALRRVLEQCDYLASRGPDGLKPLRALVKLTESNDGGMGHPVVPLPASWSRGVPLHGAVMNGHLSSLKFLVEELKVRVDWQDVKTGNTAVHEAIIWGRLPEVAYLLARGASHETQNGEGWAPAPMARRRQNLLESGTDEERAYYVRGGVPLQALVDEGLRLCAVLDGVVACGSFEAWAVQHLALPLVADAAPWLVARERRLEFCVLRVQAAKLDELKVVVHQLPKPPSKAVLKKRTADAEALAAAKAAAHVTNGDFVLQEALEKQDLGAENVLRAVRWLNCQSIQDTRALKREEVAAVDGLASAERRKLWLFVAGEQEKMATVVLTARKRAAADVLRDAKVEAPKNPLDDAAAGFAALALTGDLPDPIFRNIAYFAWKAAEPPPLGPQCDGALLEAVQSMRI
ncbi:hypothetical protein M885DRAFT_521796 [Pelagophyceae sp. CCMP2097]|nr:hypothetical protein M885DRAFT_521796 [Pelagophyceae sp. CCMP2097]